MKISKNVLAPAMLAFSLTACGGGGGGGGNTIAPSGGGTVATSPPVSAAPVTTVPVQRTVATQALTVVSESNLSYEFGGSGTLSVGRSVRASATRVTAGWHGNAAAPSAVRRAAGFTYSACANSTETATNAVSSTEEQVDTRTFYDSACTEIYQDTFVDVTAASSTVANATGNVTTYNTSGTVTDYAVLSLSLTITNSTTISVTLHETDAANANAAPTTAVGDSCQVASSAISCGGGATTSVASLAEDVGATLSFKATNTPVAGGATIAMSGTTAAYLGGLGKLTLSPGTFPAWVIGGASSTDSGTYTGTFAYASTGTLTSASVSLGDATDDASVSLSTTASTITGNITQTDSGKTYATFTVNTAGNGTITYGNGTTASIVDWQVTG